ncbi:ATP synthase F1 subunit gamma [Candidatus Nomurabacteria bacterium RIFCSPHIGHO2_02_FULL_41_18]|uniref:ATP synthase gamma chain n=1 Tax=Candidatus Nomurabacteria bacterium RIFCSPHIGHO2_02_FULL_41_18 TaxID=1801754 RepID=A0A1F6W713_9BACT|nr:MAG: ATP synthase F1 subunit gamma [Candidatus Nomurabacteria bacterium RIFCSPHIGHO2_01_FULL_41_71]OGI77693.1 MAG: ATP synthase F1 subunit gamma [Candidatus Nomurabacteria bacterium RIFCSPHIGHO2_02_FULL_41_18]OGI89034.1 MAG: ATP synthase F1 subunit gamma [Candidatus Nomurabacteria bacterium RIFCSPLOWO2_01_FULL_41_52b]OGJ00375.1 MAG: ATP synthase F1 subunit gamma [Candidatus Nomurabacteria bacterium RIFCSPLOWO2_02_FULL_41_9]
MAGTKEIKRRIKSIKNTKKITKAMELVAASKMKRAVSSTLASRFYAGYSWQILTSIAKNVENLEHPLFSLKEGIDGKKNILLLLISSNRGLCGAYNAQIIKKVISILKSKNTNVEVVSVGKKGDIAIRRLGIRVVASFLEMDGQISLSAIVPLSKFVIDEFSFGKYDKVIVAYTDFVSALTQRPNIKQILPVSRTELKDLIQSLDQVAPALEDNSHDKKIDYLFEGDQNKLIGSLAEKLTRMQIYQMLLESNASEQSSRMMAMKNASEASGEMIEDLTLVFNKARQSNITREISEISAGMASIS